MTNHLVDIAMSLPGTIFILWTYVFHVQPDRKIHRCHAEIRRLETEIYGTVMSGSLVDVEEHSREVQRIDRELKEVQALYDKAEIDEKAKAFLADEKKRSTLEATRRKRDKKYEELVRRAWANQVNANRYPVKRKSLGGSHCAVCAKSKVHHLR